MALLNWMSLAPDYNTRLYSPVELFNDIFYNKVNSFRETAWSGDEPLNKRESKFVGLV